MFVRWRQPLESILDASGVRARRVLLAGQWWTREGGPLVAEAESGEPVAILPEPRSWFGRPRYRAVSASGISAPVDAAVASGLSPAANVFYAPLPDRASALDIFWFALKSRTRDFTVAVPRRTRDHSARDAHAPGHQGPVRIRRARRRPNDARPNRPRPVRGGCRVASVRSCPGHQHHAAGHIRGRHGTDGIWIASSGRVPLSSGDSLSAISKTARTRQPRFGSCWTKRP